MTTCGKVGTQCRDMDVCTTMEFMARTPLLRSKEESYDNVLARACFQAPATESVLCTGLCARALSGVFLFASGASISFILALYHINHTTSVDEAKNTSLDR